MNQRILKINKLIKQEIGKIILLEVNFPKNIMVTVMKTKVSRDLRYVDVSVSVFPFAEKTKVEKILKERIYVIQKILNKKLCMKPLPRIRFVVDESEEYVKKIDELLKKNPL